MGEVTTKTKRPFGFYVCAMSFTFERMAYYAAKWLIAIFVIKTAAEGGLGLDANTGAKMTANLVAFTYLTPLIGGYIADKWVSARICVPVGMVLMGLGYLCGWQSHSIAMVWVMIALVSLGTGLFKGNLSGINGRLFNDKNELDAAFSIQYSFVNIGAFIGTLVVGVLVSVSGYRNCFLICGVLLFIGAAWFILGGKFLGDAGKKPFKHDNRLDEANTEVKEVAKDDHPLTKLEKSRVAAIILVTIFSVVFWMVWYLVYMPVYYYWGPDGSNHANWMIGSFTIPSSWFDSLNSLGCIILGPVLAIVWSRLARRPKGDMSMFRKTALGMLLLGSAFLIMALADVLRGGSQASILWIIMVGIVLTLGEMVFSPLGNSFINKFAAPKVLGLMLGVWPFAIFFAGKGYGYLYALLGKFSFAPAYAVVAVIVIACGVVLWVLDKKLNALVEEKEA